MIRRPYKKSLIGGVSRIRRDSYSGQTTKWWTIRKQVFDRDGGKCQSRLGNRTCNQPGKDVHHIVSLSRGGLTVMSNLITLCGSCHNARHSHMR